MGGTARGASEGIAPRTLEGELRVERSGEGCIGGEAGFFIGERRAARPLGAPSETNPAWGSPPPVWPARIVSCALGRRPPPNLYGPKGWQVELNIWQLNKIWTQFSSGRLPISLAGLPKLLIAGAAKSLAAILN